MSHDFDGSFWEEHYKNNKPTANIEPNPQLAQEVGALKPSTALDAGCGEGTDATWLASQGWKVTALDISKTALDRARRRSQTIMSDLAGSITWRQQDLLAWGPKKRYDLVISQYVHLPGDFSDYCKKLASAVASGGTLFIAAHQPPNSDKDGHHGQGSHVAVEQIVSALDAGQWDITTAENRSRQVTLPTGKETTLHDTIVRAKRL